MIKLKNFDWLLFAVVIALTGIGLLLIYSATFRVSIYRQVNFFERQFIWVFLGFIIMFLIAKVDYHFWGRIGYILYLAGIFFLLVVLIRGRVILGAQRWLEIKFPIALKQIGFQPSELLKIIVVIVLARLAIDNSQKINSWSNFGKGLCLLCIPVLFILKQPDLGTAIVNFAVGLCMLFLIGMGLRKISGVILIGVLSSPVAWFLLKDYQQERIRIFLNPYSDPLGGGYSMIQSRLAIGSGGFLGKGWLGGVQTQLDFVPEHHTDFIFAVLGEEWGYLGCILVLFLYLILILRIFHIAVHAKDRLGMFLGAGIGMVFAFHVVINIGVVIGLLPITGLPLPFLSYGGSSLISFMIAIGILQNINLRKGYY